MPITQEQADSLFQSGQISQQTYDMISKSAGPPMPPSPIAAPPPFTPPDAMPAAPMGTAGAPDFGPPPPPAPPPQAAPASEPQVDVGPIAQTSKPSPEAVPPPAAPVARPAGPAPTSGLRDQVDAQNRVLSGEKATQERVNTLDRTQAVERADIEAENRAQAEQRYVEDLAAKRQEEQHRDDLFAKRTAMVDDYLKSKVDPKQAVKERGTIGNIVAAIAVGLGAFGAGLNKGPNYALQILDKQVDDNIRAQEANIAQKGRGIAAVDGTIAQLRQITGDNEAARAGARVEMYMRQRDQIASMMAKYGDEKAQAMGTQAITAIDGKIAENSAILKQRTQQMAAQQAAAAAVQKRAEQHHAEERDDKMFERGVKLGELGNKKRELDISERKEAGGVDKEQRKLDAESTEANNQFASLVRSPVLEKIGLATAASAKLGQRLAPESSKTEVELDGVNTRVLQAIAKVAKDAEGKPNEAMLNELKNRFQINPGDTKEIAVAKILEAQKSVNALARKQGATTAPSPEGDSGADLGFKANP